MICTLIIINIFVYIKTAKQLKVESDLLIFIASHFPFLTGWLLLPLFPFCLIRFHSLTVNMHIFVWGKKHVWRFSHRKHDSSISVFFFLLILGWSCSSILNLVKKKKSSWWSMLSLQGILPRHVYYTKHTLFRGKYVCTLCTWRLTLFRKQSFSFNPKRYDQEHNADGSLITRQDWNKKPSGFQSFKMLWV